MVNILMTAIWVIFTVFPFFNSPPTSFSWSIFTETAPSLMVQGYGLDDTFLLYGEALGCPCCCQSLPSSTLAAVLPLKAALTVLPTSLLHSDLFVLAQVCALPMTHDALPQCVWTFCCMPAFRMLRFSKHRITCSASPVHATLDITHIQQGWPTSLAWLDFFAADTFSWEVL